MEEIEILEDKVAKVPKDFSLSEYMNSTFSMFSGEIRDVKLRFRNFLINAVLDRFGKSVIIIPDGDEHFTVNVKVRLGAPFFGWLFQFGSNASIARPSDIKQEYLDMLRDVIKENE